MAVKHDVPLTLNQQRQIVHLGLGWMGFAPSPAHFPTSDQSTQSSPEGGQGGSGSTQSSQGCLFGQPTERGLSFFLAERRGLPPFSLFTPHAGHPDPQPRRLSGQRQPWGGDRRFFFFSWWAAGGGGGFVPAQPGGGGRAERHQRSGISPPFHYFSDPKIHPESRPASSPLIHGEKIPLVVTAFRPVAVDEDPGNLGRGERLAELRPAGLSGVWPGAECIHHRCCRIWQYLCFFHQNFDQVCFLLIKGCFLCQTSLE